jgi:hypothetical protein
VSSLAYPSRRPKLIATVYRFTVNHVVLPDDPCEMFRTQMAKV